MAERSSLMSTPNPDPTVLTTQALQREIESVRERFDDKIELSRQVVDARLDGIINEIVALRSIVESAPDRRDQALEQIREFMEQKFSEKFQAIDTRFGERDLRATLSQTSNKEAIGAALTAVKETNTKSETAFTKQIDQLMALIYSAQKGADEKIGDIKDRLTIMESRKVGEKEATTTHLQVARDNTAVWAMVIAGVAGIVGLLNLVYTRLTN